MRRSVGGDATIDTDMKPKGFLVGLVALAAVVLGGTAAQAERRVAFVIGNSTYKNATSLPNTINDANAIAALFRSVGFEVVTSRTDLGVLDFKRAVRDFLITAETADIAVVYYAGHGIEVAGTNYLIPVDAKLARDYDVEDEAAFVEIKLIIHKPLVGGEVEEQLVPAIVFHLDRVRNRRSFVVGQGQPLG